MDQESSAEVVASVAVTHPPERRRVLRVLTDEPESAESVAAASGCTLRTVIDHLHVLREHDYADTSGGRWWRTARGQVVAHGLAEEPSLHLRPLDP